ncbi:hypothetical protein ACPTKC_29635, partial [Pseudomonas aeruginosa]
LVIHAEKDLIVATSGGIATPEAIHRARLVMLLGMRHDNPASLTGTQLSLVAALKHYYRTSHQGRVGAAPHYTPL